MLVSLKINATHLIISGFYEPDIALLQANCEQNMLISQEKLLKNDWVSMKFQKS